MRNLDTSLSRKEEALSECNTEKHNLEERIKSLESEISERDKRIENLEEMNVRSRKQCAKSRILLSLEKYYVKSFHSQIVK